MKLLPLLLLGFACPLHATTRTWVGSGSNDNFSRAANWSPAGVPQNGDTLYIDATNSPGQTVENDLLNLSLDSIVLQRGILTGNTLSITDDLEFAGGSSAKDVQLLVKLAGPVNSRRVIRVNQFATMSGGLRLDGRDVQFSFAEDKELVVTGEVSGTGDVFCIGAIVDDLNYTHNALQLEAEDIWNVDGKLTLDFVRFETHQPQPRLTGDIQVGMPGGRPGFLYPYAAIGAGNPVISYGGSIYANRDPELPHSLRGVDCVAGVTAMNLKLSGPVIARDGAQVDMQFCTLQEDPTITTEPGGIVSILDLDNDHPDPAVPLVFNGGGTTYASDLDRLSNVLVQSGVLDLDINDLTSEVSFSTYRVAAGGVLDISGDLNQKRIRAELKLEGGTLRVAGLVRMGHTFDTYLELTADSIVECVGANSVLWIETDITGPGLLNLEGDGTIHLAQEASAVTDYTGGTRIGVAKFTDNNGHLRGLTTLGRSGAASSVSFRGDFPGTVRLKNNTQVEFDPASPVDATTFTFEGSGTVKSPFEAGLVEVLGIGSQAVIKGALDVDQINVVQTSSRLTCEKQLATVGQSVTKTGAGALRLTSNGAGLVCDQVNVQQGTFELAKTTPNTSSNETEIRVLGTSVLDLTGIPQLHPGIDVEMEAGATFDASGLTGANPEIMDALNGAGNVILPVQRLALGSNDGTAGFGGVFSGSGGLEKRGSGMLTLTGISTHTGVSKVTSGTLKLDGAFSAGGIEVSGRGFLSGDGQLAGLVVKNGGIVARPGGSATLTTTSALFESGSVFSVEIGGSGAAPAFGKLLATGAVTLQSGATFRTAGSVSPQTGSVLRLLDKTSAGAISGSFNGLPEGAPLPLNAATCTASYTGGTGNDFALTSISAPNQPPNQAPALPTPPVQHLNEGAALNLALGATDPDAGQTLAYSIVSGAPADMTLDPVTGQLSWTATEKSGGSQIQVVLRVTDNGTPALSAQATLVINVAEINSAPAFKSGPTAAELTVSAGELLRFDVEAFDSDLPKQTLAFGFQGNVPAGMAIDAEGIVTWPTDEFDPAATPAVTVIVTDSGSPAQNATKTFNVTRLATLHDPLPKTKKVTLTAGDLLSVSMATTDPDVPPQPIQYAPPVNPPAVPITIDSAGLVTWQTLPDTTPGTYGPFRFLASHAGGQPVELKLRVVVEAPNTKPKLRVVDDLALAPGESTSFTLRGSDADLPEQTLTYALVGTLPAGLSLNPSTGVVSFTANVADDLDHFPLTARVTDSGSPAKSAEREFRVYVRSGTPPANILLTIEKRDPQPGYKLTFPLPANLIYEVQSSDDLIEWTTRETATSGPGAETYLANPEVPRRFFRIHVP